MTAIRYEQEGPVASIVWDMPGRSMNVLDESVLVEFEEALDRALADESVTGLIITSGKPAFIAGSDLSWLARSLTRKPGQDPEAHRRAVFAEMMALQDLWRKVETGGKPVVAAIPGTALGGGFELCLACHRRILADAPKTLIGLPESTLGLLPGAGGTARYARMLGVKKALPLLWDGVTMAPAKALELGLVDAVVPPDRLLAEAREWLAAATPEDAVKPWDKRRYTPPGPDFRTGIGGWEWANLNAGMRSRSRGNFTALEAIQSAVYDGWLVPMDTALKIEVKYFVGLLLGDVACNMIRTKFTNWQHARKLPARPAGVEPATIGRVGVVGSGPSGAAFARLFAKAKTPVAVLGRRAVEGDGIDKLDSAAALGDCDVLIDAGSEDPSAAEGLPEVADALTLTTGFLAPPPADGPGLHLNLCLEAERNPMLELVAAPAVAPEALAKAFDVARSLRKTPIPVTTTGPGYLPRLAAAYIREGLVMLAEGAAPALIENAGKSLSLPLGPLALADRYDLQGLASVLQALALGDRDAAADASARASLDRLISARGSDGRFYRSDEETGDTRLWRGLADAFERADAQPALETVKRRLLTVQEIEAVLCHDSGMFSSLSDADVAAVYGLGFAPWTGGPLSHIDTLGADAFTALCRELATARGPRFEPPASLGRRAEAGERFYGSLDLAA